MSTALAKHGGGFIVQPNNLAELKDFCIMLANSELVPRDYQGKPANVLVAIQMGAELGVAPLQALSNIAVINGRGSIWGDLMLALCMARPDYVDTVETYDAATKTARCIAKRQGRADKDWTFSWAEAANVKQKTRDGVIALTDKDTYKNYPRRMLQQRARGFALRDQWTDVLKGVITREEAEDYPHEVRAEVVSQKTIEEPKTPPKTEAKVERKSEPPPVAAVPLFSKLFPNTEYADKPLTDAPFEILEDYRVWLQAILQDGKRARHHKQAQLSLDKCTAEVDRRIEAEAEKQAPLPAAEPDPVAVKLQEEIDNRGREPRESQPDGWGLEAPQ